MNQNDKDMKDLTETTKTELAIQIVIMDAIEKGHTNENEIIQYMKSDVFDKAVSNYKNQF